MNPVLNLEDREFYSLKRVPTKTLWAMYHEMESECSSVDEEARAWAETRTGLSEVKGMLIARGEIETERLRQADTQTENQGREAQGIS